MKTHFRVDEVYIPKSMRDAGITWDEENQELSIPPQPISPEVTEEGRTFLGGEHQYEVRSIELDGVLWSIGDNTSHGVIKLFEWSDAWGWGFINIAGFRCTFGDHPKPKKEFKSDAEEYRGRLAYEREKEETKPEPAKQGEESDMPDIYKYVLHKIPLMDRHRAFQAIFKLKQSLKSSGPRWVNVQDQDSHWYCIPHDDYYVFQKDAENIDEDTCFDFEDKWSKYRTGGGPESLYCYKSPK